MRLIFFFLLVSIVGLFSCQFESQPKGLPFLGNHDIADGDTTYFKIPAFNFVNQDSQFVSNTTFAGKAYVADFFFTSCPTICPKVKKQMMRIHERYDGNDPLLLLSHSIDTKYDTVGRLKQYADNLGVGLPRWHFVTGEKEEIYNIAPSYMSIAIEDPDAPGGFDHSGWLILIDQEGHLRSFCNGTEEADVTKFMEDIDWLLADMQNGD